MFDEIEYKASVGDFVWHPEVRVPVRIAALFRGPIDFAELEVAGTRFSALTSTLSPAYA